MSDIIVVFQDASDLAKIPAKNIRIGLTGLPGGGKTGYDYSRSSPSDRARNNPIDLRNKIEGRKGNFCGNVN